MFYPVLLELHDRPVLVVGGGPVAERKVAGLLESGAAVTLVSPEVTPGLQRLGEEKSIRVRLRRFQNDDLDSVFLVISATDEPAIQEHVARLARKKGILLNTVDQPRLCDFILPAIVRRDDVVVAISTSGKSPALAAALRERLEATITGDVARAVRILGEIRSEVQSRFSDADERKQVFERIVASGILDWIADYDDESALNRVRGIIGKTE